MKEGTTMQLNKVQLVYFSATEKTKCISQAVAKGTGLPIQEWDATAQRAHTPFQPDNQTLTILAAPVFVGRIPQPFLQRLQQLKGKGPAVLLVTYGARASEDALLELKAVAQNAGYLAIAAGEFVAQHSMATSIAEHRPTAEDLQQAEEFGRKAAALAQSIPIDKQVMLDVPGEYPYRNHQKVIFSPTANKKCVECGRCADRCPVGAIPAEHPNKTNKNICISCMRCVFVCPVQARSIGVVAEQLVFHKIRKLCDENQPNRMWFANLQ